MSSEESQKENLIPPPKPPRLRDPAATSLDNDEGDRLAEAKSSSETDTAGTPSFKTASNTDHFSRKSSCEEDSDKSQASSLTRKEDPAPVRTAIEPAKVPPLAQPPKEQVIPMLPKPLSARAERNKLAQSVREKTAIHDSRKKESHHRPLPTTGLRQAAPQHNACVKGIPPPAFLGDQNVDISRPINVEAKRLPLDKEMLQKLNKMSDIAENEVSSSCNYTNISVPLSGVKEKRLPKPPCNNYSVRKKGNSIKYLLNL